MFKRFWWMLLAMPLLGSFVCVLIAAVMTYLMPKKYESEATIEVRPHPMSMASMNGETGAVPVTPQFFGTQFEMIKSRPSLTTVVENLQLVNKWGVDQETAIRILKGIIDTRNTRGTDLISIKVRHTSREDARDITREVAKVYKAHREEVESGEAAKMLGELNKAVRDQEDKVEEDRKVLATIVRTKGIVLKKDGSNDPEVVEIPNSSPGEDSHEEAIRRGIDAQDYVDAKRDFETDQDLLQKLRLEQINHQMNKTAGEESVLIHEEPALGMSPVSPNVGLNVLIGAAGGLLLGWLLAIPIMAGMNGMFSKQDGPENIPQHS